MNSTRSTDFITPKSALSRTFRDAVLELAEHYPFARTLVNSGRLALPYVLSGSPLNTADSDDFAGNMVPGAACADAPVRIDGKDAWLLDQLGTTFKVLLFADRVDDSTDAKLRALADGLIPVQTLIVNSAGAQNAGGQGRISDDQNIAAQRYDARPGSCYLIRPDQHVAARWRVFDPEQVQAALATAVAKNG